MADTTRAARIRDLNDALRCKHTGGQVLITAGLQSLGDEAVSRILNAVAAFDGFSEDNDPYGEHDCAVLTVDGRRIIWKIDYYDKDAVFASPDPTNPELTSRVMTVMLADEY